MPAIHRAPNLPLLACACLALAWGCAGPAVTLRELADYQGQAGFAIATPAATWIYHRQGAGLAALLDRDGVDWIGYSPEGGPAGQYRGIPNLIHPELQFHPGGEGATSEIVERSGDLVAIESATSNGAGRGVGSFARRTRGFG